MNEFTKESRYKKTFVEFCEDTTVHGPGHAVKGKSLKVKVFWILVFSGAMIGVSVHLVLTIMNYASHPSQEVTSISAEPPQFPRVTLCNQNPISKTNMENFLKSNPSSNTSWFEKQVNWIKPKLPTLQSAFPHADDLFASPASYFENIGDVEAEQIGHRFKDFVLDCTFEGLQCTEDDFEHFVHPFYFNCYTFTGREIRKQAKDTGEGPTDGLSLVLYLEEGPEQMSFYNRFSPISNSLGARVQIHAAGDYPRPDIKGIDVRTGASTSLALRVEEIEKLTQPYGNCTERNLSSEWSHVNYSSSLCYSICAQQYIFKQCGCYVATLPFYGEYQPTCGSFHLDAPSGTDKLKAYMINMDCQKRAWRIFKSVKTSLCDCQPECMATKYFFSMSESLWPAGNVHADFLTEYLIERTDKDLIAYHNLYPLTSSNADPNVLAGILETQFARVNIYFSDLEVVVRRAVPSYLFSQLLCDVGGTLGLWAGISIITCLEVLGLFVNLFKDAFRRKGTDPVANSDKSDVSIEAKKNTVND